MITRLRTSRTLATVALVSASGAVALAAVQAAKRAAAPSTDSVVVATVNGEKITRGELLDQLLADQAARLSATLPQIQEQNKQQRPTAGIVGAIVVKKMAQNNWAPVTISRNEIMNFAFAEKSQALVSTLDMLIQEKAVAQEAKKLGVSATPGEIAAKTSSSFKNAKQTPGLSGKSDADVVKALGLRPQYVKQIMTLQVNLENLIKKDVTAKIGHAVGPDDFRVASHILVRVNPSVNPPVVNPDDKNPKPADDGEKAWAEGKKKIEGILADIRSGKVTFEQAAQQYSDDGSKFQKGSLGLFARGQMVPEFDKVAFSQEKGKISDPVRSPFGWHIIRVDKLGTETTAKERDEVWQRQLQQKMQAKVQEVMGKAKIDNKIKPATPVGMGMPMGGGRPVPGGR